MKTTIKTMAMTMVATLCLGIVACSSNDDDNGGGTTYDLKASATPKLTITDSNGNPHQLTHFNRYTIAYDAQGRPTSIKGDGDEFIIGDDFTITDNDERTDSYNGEEERTKSTRTYKISLNSSGLVEKIAYTNYYKRDKHYTEGTKEDVSDIEQEDFIIEMAYDSRRQIQSMKAETNNSFTDGHHDDDGKAVEDKGLAKGTFNVTYTWDNDKLMSITAKRSYSGEETDEGKTEKFNYSEDESVEFTYTPGTDNPTRQFAAGVFNTITGDDDVLGILAVCGLFGIGPAQLPSSYSDSRKEIENGEEHNHKHSGQFVYTFDANGLLTSDGMCSYGYDK